jgi:uncharacterized protein (TIGR00730 family)
VPELRKYQLQNERANRLIADLLDAAEVPADRRGYFQQLLTTVLKLHEDHAGTGDLKITTTALKELRYAFKVFAPYSTTRKVTVFGSARATSSEEATQSARLFGKRMTEERWMVVTGAGAGIMGAAQEGAGGEQSFGLNIRLPFEQEANPWIADDPKLVTFKYFFTRKLFLVKEASAVALFPGGYGTMDETFELLTLMQTGKSALIPVVLVEAGPKPYWRIWHRWIAGTLVERGLIDNEDTSFFRIVDSPEEAVAEVTSFYRRRRPGLPAHAPARAGEPGRALRQVRGHPQVASYAPIGAHATGVQRVSRLAQTPAAVRPPLLRTAPPAHRLRQPAVGRFSLPR